MFRRWGVGTRIGPVGPSAAAGDENAAFYPISPGSRYAPTEESGWFACPAMGQLGAEIGEVGETLTPGPRLGFSGFDNWWGGTSRETDIV